MTRGAGRKIGTCGPGVVNASHGIGRAHRLLLWLLGGVVLLLAGKIVAWLSPALNVWLVAMSANGFLCSAAAAALFALYYWVQARREKTSVNT